MPSWTLDELMSNSTRLAGHRADIAASDVSLWVNQAYQDFVREVPELLSEKTNYFSLNSGDSLVSLPADFYTPIVISHQTTAMGSSRTLKRMDPMQADARGYYPVDVPRGYFIFNDQIQIWPSANSSANTTAWSGRSYLMRYLAVPSDMTAAAAVPSIATQHRIGILHKSVQYINELVGNHEEAAAASIRYGNFVLSLKDAIARKQGDRQMSISLADRTLRQRRVDGDLRDQDVWKRV